MTTRYQIEIKNNKAVFSIDLGKNLLAAMEIKNKKGIKVGCRKGGCGLCKILVLKGDYSLRKMSRRHITEQEQTQGYALACCLFPSSDLVIESNHEVTP